MIPSLAFLVWALAMGVVLLILGARLASRQGVVFHEAAALSPSSRRLFSRICLVAGCGLLVVAAFGWIAG